MISRPAIGFTAGKRELLVISHPCRVSAHISLDSHHDIGHFRRTMYAVIKSGGKQYRVTPGDTLQIEKLSGDLGSSLTFNEVLLVAQPSGDQSEIWLGKPLVEKAKVEAQIIGQGRGEKTIVFKRKRRKGYRLTQGHRQEQTQVLITSIENGSGGKDALSAADTKKKVDSFFSLLKPKGEAQTPKTLGSRKRQKSAQATEAKA